MHVTEEDVKPRKLYITVQDNQGDFSSCLMLKTGLVGAAGRAGGETSCCRSQSGVATEASVLAALYTAQLCLLSFWIPI